MYTQKLNTYRFAACYWHRTYVLEIDAATYIEALDAAMQIHPAAARINRLTDIKKLNFPQE